MNSMGQARPLQQRTDGADSRLIVVHPRCRILVDGFLLLEQPTPMAVAFGAVKAL